MARFVITLLYAAALALAATYATESALTTLKATMHVQHSRIDSLAAQHRADVEAATWAAELADVTGAEAPAFGFEWLDPDFWHRKLTDAAVH